MGGALFIRQHLRILDFADLFVTDDPAKKNPEKLRFEILSKLLWRMG